MKCWTDWRQKHEMTVAICFMFCFKMIQQCTLLSNPVEQNWLFHITGTLLSLTVSRHDKNTQQHQSTGHLLLWRKFTRSVHCTAHGDSGLSVALTVIEIISFAPCNIQILLGVVTSTYASWVAHVKALNLYIYILTSELWHTQKRFLNFDIYAPYLQCESPAIILIFTPLE